MTNEELNQDFHLENELHTAIKLIKLGFGELQNLNSENTFYYLPFQLLSSGFERLMKCHICLGYYEQHAEYPSIKYLKGCGGNGGHDLLELKKKILDSYFLTHNTPALTTDLAFLADDANLENLVDLLSEFGKYARYYNFDVVTLAQKPSRDVIQLWKQYESNLAKSLGFSIGDFSTMDQNLAHIRRKIIIQLETFVRAICRQFTIGKLGGKAKQYSGVLHEFIFLRDQNLGNRNYRTETTQYQEKTQKTDKPKTVEQIRFKTHPSYRKELINRDNFNGDWPFYHDEVTIGCYDKHWFVVTIENQDYALNGAAQGRLKLEDVHKAGMAIFGKSVSPFIEIAQQLGVAT